MKILWLTAYPWPRGPRVRPAPWVVTLAGQLSRQPGVELTILSWSPASRAPREEFDHAGIHFIYLRSPAVRHDVVSRYQTRIRRAAGFLRRHLRQYDCLCVHRAELPVGPATQLPMLLGLSVPGLLARCVPVPPTGFAWRYLLGLLTRYYALLDVPRNPNSGPGSAAPTRSQAEPTQALTP